MRTEEFKVERHGLLKAGDEVTIRERSTEAFYYYIVEPAQAMSGNFSLANRILSRRGVVKEIKEDARGWFAMIEFES